MCEASEFNAKLLEDLHSAISSAKSFDGCSRQQLHCLLDIMFKRFRFYEDIALHGRDSDDAKHLVMCRNDERDFIRIDLEQ